MSERFLIWIVLVALVGAVANGFATPLDDYVKAPDDTYNYTIENEVHSAAGGISYTIYQVRLTSQRWRTIEEVDEPVWRHWLQIVVPDKLKTNLGLLVIEGGGRRSNPPNVEPYAGMIVGATGAVMALLQQVPNQPLRFSDDPRERKEDGIIAYSYDKFMVTGDPTWPALLPMVKSAVRALDTVQAVTREKGLSIDEFVVAGASKRGWTTWLTSAVDKRVKACLPIVIDVLNMEVQMDHHFEAYGRYSEAVGDYVEKEVFKRFGTPEARKLLDIVDPYTYLNRLNMPKYVLNATGDEFFVLDSSRHYYHDLPGKKMLRCVPNSGHGISADMTTAMSLVQFFVGIAEDKPFPAYSWTFENDGSMRVETDGTESTAMLWQATNLEERDFRYFGGKGPAWNSTPLTPESEHTYTVHVERPPQGWTAFLVELTYSSGLILSTEVGVTPDCLPYDDPDGDGKVSKYDDDDDDDGVLDGEDIAPCDADDDGLPDRYESGAKGARTQDAPPGSLRVSGNRGFIVLGLIFAALVLAAVLALVYLTRR